MRVLFIVQGEGRGHLTQAVALAQLLQRTGHTVIGAWVNVAANRGIPPFFAQQFTAPITLVQGPQLVYNSKTGALDLLATLWGTLQKLTCYRRSLSQLNEAIRATSPDVVVNFFELLGGVTYGVYRPKAPMVCVGHQCMALHPDFPFPAGQWVNRLLFKGLVRLNAWGARECLGLSFDPQSDQPGQRLRVMPPLLRQELTARQTELSQPPSDEYIVAYTTQPGLQDQVVKAHNQCPTLSIRYFHPTTKVVEQRTATLAFHPIDGQRYLDALQQCRAVLTTAGFESVCEALYLGKPVLMMPQPRHYEQACNALDGQRAGAGIAATSFDLHRLLNFAQVYDTARGDWFRHWQAQSSSRFVTALQGVLCVNGPIYTVNNGSHSSE